VSEVFLDTAYAIAGCVPADAFHAKAVQLTSQIKSERTFLITTRAVLLEIGNALSRQRNRWSTF
jgi:predicted nucleic acid-binding protein